jgi:hypothetical protein
LKYEPQVTGPDLAQSNIALPDVPPASIVQIC